MLHICEVVDTSSDSSSSCCVEVHAGGFLAVPGHHNNVSAVLFHPRLPIILSGGEDGTVRLWHSSTYRAETTLNYGMERVWSLAASTDSNKVAIGFDEGTVVLKLGNEVPVASLDSHTGRVVWAQNSEIQTASLKGLAAESNAQDGEKLPIVPKDLGATELFPQSLKHNCNGRFLVVCGDGEYVIYTAQGAYTTKHHTTAQHYCTITNNHTLTALRNKAFGAALDFAWSAAGTGDYAIRESLSRVKTFKNFKEAHTLRPPVAAADALFGGACLGVRGSDSVVFFDWDEGVMRALVCDAYVEMVVQCLRNEYCGPTVSSFGAEIHISCSIAIKFALRNGQLQIDQLHICAGVAMAILQRQEYHCVYVLIVMF
eukprot:4944-Heterococcus_DN1.PRE.1